MEDCTYVMSVASPVVMGSVSVTDEQSINKQAVEGIQRILRAAENECEACNNDCKLWRSRI